MEYVHPIERQLGATQEPYGLALNEITLAREQGHDVTRLQDRLQTIDRDDAIALRALYAAIPKGPPPASPFFEDSAWPAIEVALPPASPPQSVDAITDRLEGAWAGRIAGNMLGKPVEWQWPRGEIEAYLRSRDAWPLNDYIPIDKAFCVTDVAEAVLQPHWMFFVHEGLSRGEIAGGVRDDDIDFSVLALHILETFGPDYTTHDVAHEWLTRFPLNALFTAERAAYNNLVRRVPLDLVGETANPFREWIGALIRADVHGYIHAGNPRAAARSTFADAWLSHRGNGIYGALWAAALIATAFSASSPERSIVASLDHLPARSRLAQEITAVLADFRCNKTWEAAMDALDIRHAGMNQGHTINNAGALTAAILWGDGDFTATITMAVRAGLDADSIGATAGSWAGAFNGLSRIPDRWIAPLHDRIRSGVFGYGDVRIGDLARRTHALASLAAAG